MSYRLARMTRYDGPRCGLHALIEVIDGPHLAARAAFPRSSTRPATSEGPTRRHIHDSRKLTAIDSLRHVDEILRLSVRHLMIFVPPDTALLSSRRPPTPPSGSPRPPGSPSRTGLRIPAFTHLLSRTGRHASLPRVAAPTPPVVRAARPGSSYTRGSTAVRFAGVTTPAPRTGSLDTEIRRRCP